MDKESFLRLGLNSSSIDFERSAEIYDPDTNKHIINIYLIKDKNIYCPHCGAYESYVPRGSVKQKISHSSMIENNITIILHKKVYICDCGKTFRELNPFIKGKKRNTKEREYRILESLRDINKSFKDVADEFNVSITSIQNIFDNNVKIPRQTLTEVLCVDEVYSKHCGYHKYCFITYSPQLDKILDVLPSRNKEDLCGYFGKISREERNKVKYFSMDLYEVYRQVAHLCFPNALVCADHFHVIKNIGDCFNAARIRIMKKYEYLKGQNDSWYWLYKKYWRKLFKDSSNLGYKKYKVNKTGLYLDDHQVVDYMLKINNELREAYELYTAYRNFNSIATIETAEKELDELILKFYKSKIEEYNKAYKLLKRWRTEIINSFHKLNDHVISNGGLERANRDIKSIIRLAYGYKNFDRLRNRIMYIKNK